jgi:hypothetical protein
MSAFKLYWRNWFVGLDRFINTWFGGSDLETISSRVCRYKEVNVIAKHIYKLLNWIDYKHCEESLEPEDHWKDKEVLK